MSSGPDTPSAMQKRDSGTITSPTQVPEPFPELKGYLKKKSRQARWQKRWFEANDHYLTYYKTQASPKLLACIDLNQCGHVTTGGDGGDATELEAGEFSLALGDRFYVIRAETQQEAERWVEGLNQRKDASGAAAASAMISGAGGAGGAAGGGGAGAVGEAELLSAAVAAAASKAATAAANPASGGAAGAGARAGGEARAGAAGSAGDEPLELGVKPKSCCTIM